MQCNSSLIKGSKRVFMNMKSLFYQDQSFNLLPPKISLVSLKNLSWQKSVLQMKSNWLKISLKDLLIRVFQKQTSKIPPWMMNIIETILLEHKFQAIKKCKSKKAAWFLNVIKIKRNNLSWSFSRAMVLKHHFFL